MIGYRNMFFHISLTRSKIDMVLFSSPTCPRCKVLKAKLKLANIVFSETEDYSELIATGISELPILKIGEKYYNFSSAIKYINENGANE